MDPDKSRLQKMDLNFSGVPDEKTGEAPKEAHLNFSDNNNKCWIKTPENTQL